MNHFVSLLRISGVPAACEDLIKRHTNNSSVILNLCLNFLVPVWLFDRNVISVGSKVMAYEPGKLLFMF